ncbi:hypothetical protein TNCV_3251671 [Trichonephila clavipes]|nr:hypothetical protein TNCV_3251671 [Trichonephila clavipes]
MASESNNPGHKSPSGGSPLDVDDTVKGTVRTLVTEFKSDMRAQRRVRTEWNVNPPTSKSIHQWDRILKETGTLVSQKLASILKFS